MKLLRTSLARTSSAIFAFLALATGCATAPQDTGASSDDLTGASTGVQLDVDGNGVDHDGNPTPSNMRDIGGYAAGADKGERVKMGMIYRSNHLGSLNDRGKAFVSGLHLRMIGDFRSDPEIGAQGADAVLDPSVVERFTVVNPAPPADGALDAAGAAALAANDANALDAYLVKKKVGAEDAYKTNFLDPSNIDAYARLLHELASGKMPALYHCSAGKDRTGFATAVLHRILGVSPEDMMKDYLLSNTYVAKPSVDQLLARMGANYTGDRAVFETHLYAFFGVDADYLTAAFTAIDAKYGSFDRYVADALRMSPADLTALREAMLEPAAGPYSSGAHLR
jgi:protein-tyrosine phosphatase